MIKILRRIWDTFGDKDFFGKIVIPSGGVFFTLGTLAQFYSLTLSKNDLVKTTGTVEWISGKTEQGVKGNRYYPLVIYLSDQEDYYRIKDTFNRKYKTIKEQIKPGDNILLYTRSTLQTIIGWGQENDIYAIDKGENVIFDIELMRDYKRGQIESFGIFAFICWMLYGLYRYNKFSEEKGSRQQNV